MKKFFLAAAIAMAPVLAATSADAITVPPGSNLEITVTGNYATQDGNDISIGSVFDLNNTFVTSVNAGAGVTGAPGVFSFVAVSDSFTLADGANNSGVSFTFLGASGASFTISQSGGSVVTPSGTGTGTGESRQFGLGVLANGSTESGSFSFCTTSDSSTGTYQTTFAVPPNQDIEEEFDPISAIPLPAAAWMLLAGLGSLWAFRRRTHA